MFMLMMKTNIGPVDDGSSFAYLRAETAQSTYLNFKNVVDSTSRKLPFGIVQNGKVFRNEITPRNFLFRLREFEQAEMQFFVVPGEDEKWFDYWKQFRTDWWVNQGIPRDMLRYLPHETMSHYAKAAEDIEYKFPWGFDEIEGLHNRQDFDLGSHTKNQDTFDIKAKVMKNTDSVTKFSYFDAETKKEFIPFIVETAMGVDRAFMALITQAYTEETLDNGETRIVLKLMPHIAPVKVAIIPLKRNEPRIVEKAKELKNRLMATGIGRIMFEDTGNIGKGYRRHDEIGTPYCLTVDFETLDNDTVTIRDRDSMQQQRIPLAGIEGHIRGLFKE